MARTTNIVNGYATTTHFRERLIDRFNVHTDPLEWARNFFRGYPELVVDQGDTQKWSNGNIVVVISTKTKNYITAYPISETHTISSDALEAFKQTADELISRKEKETIRRLDDLKHAIVTKRSDPAGSLEKTTKATLEMNKELMELAEYKRAINTFLESAISEKESDGE